jgi:hypothetical protein
MKCEGEEVPTSWPAPASCTHSSLAGAGKDSTAGASVPSALTLSVRRNLRPVELLFGSGVSWSYGPAHQNVRL